MRKIMISSATLVAILLSLVAPALASSTGPFDVSAEGLAFIKQYETFSSSAYAAGGTWYIGYGTPCDQNAYPDGISEAEAEDMLLESLTPHIKNLNEFIASKNLRLEQHQFDALLSFTHGIGNGWMSSSYRIYNYLIDGIEHYDDAEIVDAMAVWCHVQSAVNEAYLQRRIEEGQLLLYGDYKAHEANFHYLILNADGGVIENDTACYSAGVPYGTLPTAVRADYVFDGWYTRSGVRLSEADTVTQSIAVTAQWLAQGSLTFSDVKADDWYYTYVYDLYQSGVVDGTSATTFEPQLNVTYGQALKLILLAVGNPEQAITGTHWAIGYLDFAIKHGLLSNAQMDLEAPISRVEIAEIAAKALGLSRVGYSSPFSDTSNQYVLELYDMGIVEGSYENDVLVFKPESNITRAEISAIIWRIDKLEAETQETDTGNDSNSGSGNTGTTTPPKETITFGKNNTVVEVLDGVPKNEYTTSLFSKDDDGYMHYNANDYTYEIGIDVSIYQADIDWEKVKDAGIDFAIIRVGGRGYGEAGTIYEDAKFEQNIEGALEAGIGVGVYFFSQAISAQEAIEEANYVLDKIRGYDLTYPVVFDWEKISRSDARTSGLSTELLCSAANAFCQTVENAGYQAMVYFNLDVGYLHYDLREIMKYDFWLAQYNTVPTFYYHFDMWQYTDNGEVDGIAGRVDMNINLIKK